MQLTFLLAGTLTGETVIKSLILEYGRLPLSCKERSSLCSAQAGVGWRRQQAWNKRGIEGLHFCSRKHQCGRGRSQPKVKGSQQWSKWRAPNSDQVRWSSQVQEAEMAKGSWGSRTIWRKMWGLQQPGEMMEWASCSRCLLVHPGSQNQPHRVGQPSGILPVFDFCINQSPGRIQMATQAKWKRRDNNKRLFIKERSE